MTATRNQLQWLRKIFHVINGSIGCYLYIYSPYSKTFVLLFLAACVLFSASVDLLRFQFVSVNQFFSNHLSFLIRKEEQNTFNSTTTGLLASLLVLLIFNPKVGILLLLFITYADPLAGIVGSLYGKTKLNEHASLEGCLAFFCVAFALSLFATLSIFEMSFSFKLVLFSFLAALIGMWAESFFPQWDDNWVLPAFSSPLLAVLVDLFF